MKNNPPQDGTPILALFNSYPYKVMAMWCGASSAWCAAVPHCGMYQGEMNDHYFENEHFAEDDIRYWEAV
jgi:hypothetical protein